MYQDNTINQTSWEKRQEKHKRWIKSLWKYFGIGTICLLLFFFLLSKTSLPSFEELQNPNTFRASEIFAADGSIVGRYYSENRVPVEYDKISPNVINALIATEDERFYDHSGIDAEALGRVVFKTLIGLDQSSGGGSTITQQLAKMLFTGVRANNIFASIDAKELVQIPDSLLNKKLSKNTLDNFELEEKIMILNASVSKTNRLLSTITNNTEILKFKRKVLNLYETEYYNRVALSLSCVILFFIGAPLGSIVRKGGFGMPMILAIAVYVTYHFSNTFGKGLAENSSVTAFLGSWISGIIMIPIAILLTYRATKDKGLFNIDTFLQPITELFKKILPKKRQQ